MVYSEANKLGEEGASEPCLHKHHVTHGTLIETLHHQPPCKLKMYYFPAWGSFVVGMHLGGECRRNLSDSSYAAVGHFQGWECLLVCFAQLTSA